MKVHVCTFCKILYKENRPFVCPSCSANVFFKEFEATPEEVEELHTQIPDLRVYADGKD